MPDLWRELTPEETADILSAGLVPEPRCYWDRYCWIVKCKDDLFGSPVPRYKFLHGDPPAGEVEAAVEKVYDAGVTSNKEPSQ